MMHDHVRNDVRAEDDARLSSETAGRADTELVRADKTPAPASAIVEKVIVKYHVDTTSSSENEVVKEKRERDEVGDNVDETVVESHK
jgi:hypothetical protein